MDTVKFVIEDYVDEKGGYRFPTINVYVNNLNLIDLVQQVEQQNQISRGQEPSAGQYYIGFEPSYRGFRDEFLGLQRRPLSVLLSCTCTYAECNCIMAKVTMDAQTVTWTELKNPWFGGATPSPWIAEEEAQAGGWIPFDYSSLGPFVFDREQYMDALNNIIQL